MQNQSTGEACLAPTVGQSPAQPDRSKDKASGSTGGIKKSYDPFDDDEDVTRAVLAAAGFLRPPARTSAPEPRSNSERETEPADLIEKLAETARLVKSE